MADKMSLLLEAERRGILPPEKAPLLQEARRRGLLDAQPQQRKPLQAPVEKSVEPVSQARAVLDQGLQGATFNLADEITDGAGALGAYLYGKATGGFDESLSSLYSDARSNSKERSDAQFEQFPKTSIASNVVGGLTTGGAALSALKQGAPRAASALGKFATANPYTAAAGVGGVSGGLYGFGGGEGTPEERGKDALMGGAVGVLASPVAAFAGRNVISPLASKLVASKPAQSALAKVSERFNKKPITGKSGAPIELAEKTPMLAAQGDEMFTKTAGQRTQNPDLQRLEIEARAGALTPDAQKAILSADRQQNQEYKSFIDKLSGGIDEGSDINNLIENVGGVISKKAAAANQAVNSAYDLARQGGSVKIDSNNIRQGLWKNIADTRREAQYDVSQMPLAKGVLKRLAKYSKSDRLSKVSAVKLGELENFRKQATNAIQSSGDLSEKRFLRQIVGNYDNFMERTATEAVDSADSAAINAFRDAVGKRREYGQLYQSNKLVEEIVGGQKSVDDTVKTLLGTGSIKGKKDMANNFKALVKAAGDEGEAVTNDLRQAFMQRILQKADVGFEAGSDTVKRLSPARLGTELESLFVNQKDFATELYGKEAVKSVQKAIKELKLISSLQSNVQSSSGSGEVITRTLRALSNVPVLGRAAGPINSVMDSSRQFNDTSRLVQSLEQFSNSPIKTKSALWSVAPPVGSAATLNQGE